jgi:hypothetical protein
MAPIARRGAARGRTSAVPRKPRTIDPRLIAPLAFVVAAIALALTIVYAVGHFVEATIQAVPTI